MKVLCIDAGTSSIKSQVFNPAGPATKVFRVPSRDCFDLKKGIIDAERFIERTLDCFDKILTETNIKDIDRIGITTVGPSNAVLKNKKKITEVRNYNYNNCRFGVEKIIKHNLYKVRGLGAGGQFTPEQILELQHKDKLPKDTLFTSFASLLCQSFGADVNKWTYPEASYNGLIDVGTGEYARYYFDKFGFKESWFPKLTTGKVGYLAKKLVKKYKLPKAKIPIYNFGTDGPSLQAYMGNGFSTFKVESTCAFRVSGRNPIYNKSPMIKGFPGVWNVLFKEPQGHKYFVSGATVNAGVNTIRYYFSDITNKQLKELDNSLIQLMKKDIPTLRETGVELPFEFGERDGIDRPFGIMGKKPRSKILKYYALKEGVMFNMLQRVLLVRDAKKAAGDKLRRKFLITGPITISKPWIDLALMHLHIIGKIDNPVLLSSNYEQIGLAAIAKGIYKKENVDSDISAKGKMYDRHSLSSKLTKEKAERIEKRWKEYLKYYDKESIRGSN